MFLIAAKAGKETRVPPSWPTEGTGAEIPAEDLCPAKTAG